MNSQKSILLTGGTGLIGRHLTAHLLGKGYSVSHLSRSRGNDPQVKTFLWDVEKGQIDKECLNGVDTIVHLAGANIAEKRWTERRKKELIDSRTESIRLIYELMGKTSNTVTSVISASAIGYYSDRGDELLTEASAPSNDFMAKCCIEWEAAVDEGKKTNVRIVKLRTGVVLDKEGALEKMSIPIKWYVGSPIGSGEQWVPWIHWLDAVEMYLFAIEHGGIQGVYNMVAPNPVTNKQLTGAIAKHLHKPLWAPNVPAFTLKLLMGEMSTIVLGSTRVSPQKIEDAGYTFKFAFLDDALEDIYG
ncbi:MAG: TIGR01777 family oxidoreductase [Bacteroidota bacterium]|nr:TIGR01777 family oxidoreductase [Bacteroidota bacterium]